MPSGRAAASTAAQDAVWKLNHLQSGNLDTPVNGIFSLLVWCCSAVSAAVWTVQTFLLAPVLFNARCTANTTASRAKLCAVHQVTPKFFFHVYLPVSKSDTRCHFCCAARARRLRARRPGVMHVRGILSRGPGREPPPPIFPPSERVAPSVLKVPLSSGRKVGGTVPGISAAAHGLSPPWPKRKRLRSQFRPIRVVPGSGAQLSGPCRYSGSSHACSSDRIPPGTWLRFPAAPASTACCVCNMGMKSIRSLRIV